MMKELGLYAIAAFKLIACAIVIATAAMIVLRVFFTDPIIK